MTMHPLIQWWCLYQPTSSVQSKRKPLGGTVRLFYKPLVLEAASMDRQRMMGPYLTDLDGVGKGVYFGEYKHGFKDGLGEFVSL